MRKIVSFMTVFILIITLSSCTTPEDNTFFDPDDYEIDSIVSVTKQSRSTATVLLSITDEQLALSHAYLTVLNSEGDLILSYKLAVAGFKEDFQEEIDLYYLLQDEIYIVSLNGYLYEDGEILSAQLSSTTLQTGVWNVTPPTSQVNNLRVGSDVAVFTVFTDFNDYKGKRITVSLYENDTLVDEIESSFLYDLEHEMVEPYQFLSDVTFENLDPDTVYNVFVTVLYRRYDYEKDEYNFYSIPEYAGTFKTGIE